jgi:hypothetical protein
MYEVIALHNVHLEDDNVVKAIKLVYIVVEAIVRGKST